LAASRPASAAKPVAAAPVRRETPERLDRPAPLTPPAVEITFLAIAIHDGGLGADLLGRHGPQEFEHPLTRRIAETASEIIAGGQPLEAGTLLAALVEDEPARKLVGELAVSDEYTVEIERQAEDCGLRLTQRGLEREMERITTEMRMAKARGDNDSVLDCARRKNDIARGLAKLTAPRTW
jgi:hypothetical protein